MSLWKSLKPVSVVPDFCKESELFVKIKSVLELCVFVKQVFGFIKFYKSKRLQNSSSLSCSWLVRFTSILKSSITIKLSHIMLAWDIDVVSSLKKHSELFWVGGLKTLKQFQFLVENVNSEQMTSLNFGSNFFSQLHIKSFFTNSINPPLLLSLCLQALILYPFIWNCADGKLLFSLVSLTTR